jgi:membrane-associated phospholipid phosphatase
MNDRLTKLALILLQPPLGWWLAVALGASLVLGLVVDLAVLEWVHTNADAGMVAAFRVITLLGDATPYVAVLLMAMGVFWLRSLRTEDDALRIEMTNHLRKCWFVLLSMGASGLIHHAIKLGLGRARPKLWFEEQIYGLQPFNLDIAQNGFPSGHSQTVWSLGIALYLVYPRFAPLYLTAATLVGVSRVMLQAHYPSDVLFGAYLGAAAALLLHRYYLAPRLIQGRETA